MRVVGSGVPVGCGVPPRLDAQQSKDRALFPTISMENDNEEKIKELKSKIAILKAVWGRDR